MSEKGDRVKGVRGRGRRGGEGTNTVSVQSGKSESDPLSPPLVSRAHFRAQALSPFASPSVDHMAWFAPSSSATVTPTGSGSETWYFPVAGRDGSGCSSRVGTTGTGGGRSDLDPLDATWAPAPPSSLLAADSWLARANASFRFGVACAEAWILARAASTLRFIADCAVGTLGRGFPIGLRAGEEDTEGSSLEEEGS